MTKRRDITRRALRHNRISRGLCRECGTPRLRDHQFCEKHLAIYREYYKRVKQKRIENSLCTSCGKPRDELNELIGARWCVHCHTRWKNKS